MYEDSDDDDDEGDAANDEYGAYAAQRKLGLAFSSNGTDTQSGMRHCNIPDSTCAQGHVMCAAASAATSEVGVRPAGSPQQRLQSRTAMLAARCLGPWRAYADHDLLRPTAANLLLRDGNCISLAIDCLPDALRQFPLSSCCVLQVSEPAYSTGRWNPQGRHAFFRVKFRPGLEASALCMRNRLLHRDFAACFLLRSPSLHEKRLAP